MRLSRAKVGSVVGALLFVVLIAAITVGSQTCARQHYPFLCFMAKIFH